MSLFYIVGVTRKLHYIPSHPHPFNPFGIIEMEKAKKNSTRIKLKDISNVHAYVSMCPHVNIKKKLLKTKKQDSFSFTQINGHHHRISYTYHQRGIRSGGGLKSFLLFFGYFYVY